MLQYVSQASLIISLTIYIYIYIVYNSLGREELITEHALHWNRNKIKKLASFLSKRYTKVSNFINKSDFISTDEDPSLRIESFTKIKLRGVFYKIQIIVILLFS